MKTMFLSDQEIMEIQRVTVGVAFELDSEVATDCSGTCNGSCSQGCTSSCTCRCTGYLD
jgi:hypothetical protein